MSAIEELGAALGALAQDPKERACIGRAIAALDMKYSLSTKMAREPGVSAIIKQLLGRIASAFTRIPTAQGKRILDIACGSNSSASPPSLCVDTPFGDKRFENAALGYAAVFEPWFCRLLIELGATPVGIDRGDLDGEAFEHYCVDLGPPGALDFLPSHSFDAVQDSRLFGSPEFTSQFTAEVDRLRVAREIRQQEQRLLKPDGIVIHSDAEELLR